MERHERDFKGIWIPREIWLSDELSLMEKVLFVEIHSLDNKQGCFASNGYFAEFFGMSTRQIATHIASLKAKGYVTVTVENHNERTIRVTGKFAYPNPQSRRLLRKQGRVADEQFSEGKLERDFKGIWIDREIWLSQELSLMEKVLFVEIHSLDNERGCFASNDYFARFFDLSIRRIAAHIASLSAKGYITLTIRNNSERTIRTTGKFAHANPQSMRLLRKQVRGLAGRLSVDNRAGGMKKTSWGV